MLILKVKWSNTKKRMFYQILLKRNLKLSQLLWKASCLIPNLNLLQPENSFLIFPFFVLNAVSIRCISWSLAILSDTTLPFTFSYVIDSHWCFPCIFLPLDFSQFTNCWHWMASLKYLFFFFLPIFQNPTVRFLVQSSFFLCWKFYM